MIYILDTGPKKISEYLDDKSLDRMIKDICNVLLLIHNRRTFISSGINKWEEWTKKCIANYNYLLMVGLICSNEWTWRNHSSQMFEPKFHKYHRILEWTFEHIPPLPKNSNMSLNKYKAPHAPEEMTQFPLVMPKKYIISETDGELWFPDILGSYRNYYQSQLNKKSSYFTKWTKREKPDWLILK